MPGLIPGLSQISRPSGIWSGAGATFRAPGASGLPGNLTAPSGGGAARGAGKAGSTGRKSGPDVGWLFWGEKAQNNGYSACTALAGYPDVYPVSTSYITLDRNRGAPWLGFGSQVSLTKPGGGYITGSLSYGLQKNFWCPALIANSNFNLSLHQQVPIPYQEGETIQAFSNSTNVDEEQIVACMVGYGGFPHPYPLTVQQCMDTIGLKPRQIWNVDCTITVAAGATATGSGAATLDTASQADLWLDSDSTYYIVGALPQTGNTGVKNQGYLNFKNNMGEYWTMRNAAIPLIAGPAAEPLSTNPGWTTPYEPIGPFRGDALPSVGGTATVAGVFTFALMIAKV